MNSCQNFSSSVMRPSRSWTRAATLRRGLRYANGARAWPASGAAHARAQQSHRTARDTVGSLADAERQGGVEHRTICGLRAPPASRGPALRSAAMDKQAVRQTLEQLAAFLELKGENPFRIRAFENAARAIAGYPGDVAEAARSGALADVKGIA